MSASVLEEIRRMVSREDQQLSEEVVAVVAPAVLGGWAADWHIAVVEVDIVVVAALTVSDYSSFEACNHHFRTVVDFVVGVVEVVEVEHHTCLDAAQVGHRTYLEIV